MCFIMTMRVKGRREMYSKSAFQLVQVPQPDQSSREINYLIYKQTKTLRALPARAKSLQSHVAKPSAEGWTKNS